MQRMTSLVALLILAMATSVCTAQQAPSQEDLKSRRDEKLKAEFLQNAPWILDYDQALAEAKKRNQPIFAYLTRSYAK